MYGAILGDMIGAPYEFDRGKKTKQFPLFIDESHFTDDTVMTIAVAEALLNCADDPKLSIRQEVVCCLQKWGRKYPHAGMGHASPDGSEKSTLSPTEAMATDRPCAYRRRDGSIQRCRRRGGWLRSPQS